MLRNRARCEAFAIGACEGAGQHSRVHCLEKEVVQMIIGYTDMIIGYTGYVPWHSNVAIPVP